MSQNEADELYAIAQPAPISGTPLQGIYFGSPPVGDFTILILDIQDSDGGTFVAGYFDPANEFPKTYRF